MSVIYTLPFDKLSALPKRLTHGWQIAGIPRATSGGPFTITDAYPVTGFGSDTYYGIAATRPQLVGTPTRNSPSNYDSTKTYFDAATETDGKTLGQQIFATPGTKSTGVQTVPGSLGRDAFWFPHTTNMDFSLFKDTTIRENLMLQFRVEAFNTFNSHYFNAMGTKLGVSGFGTFTGTTPGRVIQLGARLVF